MNGYLLDTKAFLSVLDDISRLSEAVQAVLLRENTRFHVSAASFFEITVKKALKKIKIPDNLPEIATASGFDVLAITPEHAWKAGRLPFHHTDPYDRLLISQAKIEGLTLITHDPIFAQYNIPILQA